MAASGSVTLKLKDQVTVIEWMRRNTAESGVHTYNDLVDVITADTGVKLTKHHLRTVLSSGAVAFETRGLRSQSASKKDSDTRSQLTSKKVCLLAAVLLKIVSDMGFDIDDSTLNRLRSLVANEGRWTEQEEK